MAYYRAMRAEEIVAWLRSNGYAEGEEEELAAALVDKYDVMGYSSKPE